MATALKTRYQMKRFVWKNSHEISLLPNFVFKALAIALRTIAIAIAIVPKKLLNIAICNN